MAAGELEKVFLCAVIPISLISLIYVCSFVSDIVNKPYGSRMEISYKVGVGLPAYEVIDRTYGKSRSLWTILIG